MQTHVTKQPVLLEGFQAVLKPGEWGYKLSVLMKDDIVKELMERQKDYEAKFSSSEEEAEDVEEESVSSRRTLRKRNVRLVYEEPPLEDELDFRFFKDLKQEVKASSIERSSMSDSGKAEESQDESIPESVESEDDIGAC